MAAVDLAAAHYRQQSSLGRRVARAMARLWRGVDRSAIAASWRQALPAAVATVSRGQLTAAGAADGYASALLDEFGLDDDRGGDVRPASLAGIASDGRDLAGLLYQPAITALVAIQQGASEGRALSVGLVELDMITRTQIADAGRVADGVAIAARPAVTTYTRMLNLPSCGRCILLAGLIYRWNDGFERHPQCDCRHIPTSEDAAGDLRTDPQAAYESMTPEQRVKAVTVAGARAIEDGADLGQVVNARRGMYTAGGELLTREGATRRGLAGKRLGARTGRRARRLMPEQIYRQAGNDRMEAIRLLTEHGYIAT